MRFVDGGKWVSSKGVQSFLPCAVHCTVRLQYILRCSAVRSGKDHLRKRSTRAAAPFGCLPAKSLYDPLFEVQLVP